MKTSAGTFRANWRDPAGKQKAKMFKTKKEANAYLADTESAINQGTYLDPRAGKIRFAAFAGRWEAARQVEARTAERTASILRAHLLPEWGTWPINRIDHLSVQQWVTDLGRTRAPATVTKCLTTLRLILRAAVRSRLIAGDPTEGVTVTTKRAVAPSSEPLTRETFFRQLLPSIPVEHRAIVCLAAGAGLRWGECAGLAWDAVDLEGRRLRVVQVAVETPGAVTLRPYPKTTSGVRTVPMPEFLVTALRARRVVFGQDSSATSPVFAGTTGAPPRRANFRKRVWLPSLVRAGLLGKLVKTDDGRFEAHWIDAKGVPRCQQVSTEREAVEIVARSAHGGVRFHDLRHCYASWLVTEGLPPNVVQRVMGHSRASFTLARYTHAPADFEDRVRDVIQAPADFSLTFDLGIGQSAPESETNDDG